MSVSSTSSASSSNRLTGLATGMDTDTLVKGLMKAEMSKINKLYQKKELAQWKQEAYRELTNELRTLKDEYFNVLKPGSNILSQNNYKKFMSSSSDSSVVTSAIIDSSIATAGVHSIKIDALASAGTASSRALSSPLVGTTNIDTADIQSFSGKKLKVTLDGVTKEITMKDFLVTEGSSDLKADLKAKIDIAFGEISPGVSKINVDVDGDGHLTFAAATGFTKITLTDASADNGLDILGYTSGKSNRISTTATLATIEQNTDSLLTLTGDKLNVTINDRDYEFDSTDTLSQMISTINSDSSGTVSARYDERQDKIILTSKVLGKGENITVDDTTGGFFETFTKTEGTDSKIYLDGSLDPIYSNSNNVSVNGISYSLMKLTGGDTESVTVSKDTDATYNIIKNFFDKYNTFIDKTNAKLSEKYDRNYQPLTQEQKDVMSDDDIKIWESKAKTGLLKNDPTLLSLVSDLRRAFSDPITGITGNTFDIGITTGGYYDKGKVTINEITLKDAISNNPDKVINYMAKTSTTQPTYLRSLTADGYSDRYDEEGLVNRFSDIIENNISTTSNTSGRKGYLIWQAGIQNDSSEYKNEIYNQIIEYDKSISAQNTKVSDKEAYYYKKFAAMEQAISKMNNQSSWISQQMGGG